MKQETLSQYLFIACLHAQENDVGRSTSQTALEIRLTADLLSLGVKAVQRFYRFFKQAPFDLHAIVR